MNNTKKEIALIYDFDGTLAKGNLPDHQLLPDMGIDTDLFWQEVGEVKDKTNSDEILVYMHLLAKKATEKNMALSKTKLNSYGENYAQYLFDGVLEWFDRINKFVTDNSSDNYVLKHYIISSGLHEIIEATPIAKHFKTIFASKYIYNPDGSVASPGVGINYTTKTQYLFRINKGILNHHDNKSLNKWMTNEDRPVPFDRMVFIGDGDTDIPTMKLVRMQGGNSLGVFDQKKWDDPSAQERIYKLISEDRVSYVAPADYIAGSQLDILVKGILDRIINKEK